MENHKQEIESTRIGGLGSSDANMVYRIGKNGFINEADRYRIAVMLGIEEQKKFKTSDTEYGNYIENQIFEHIKMVRVNAVSNPFYKNIELSERFRFKVFNHIDIELVDDVTLDWIEIKAVNDDIKETVNKYYNQLQWHYMILDSIVSNKTKRLFIAHYNTPNKTDEFNPENIKTEFVQRDEMCMSIIERGLKIISDEIKLGFKYEAKEELYADCLPEAYQQKMSIITMYIAEIKAKEAEIDTFKEKMLALMTENNIKSIKNESFIMTVVPESKSIGFDAKAFEKEEPKLYQQYKNKETIKKSYLLLKAK